MATRVFYVACHCHLKDALNYLFTCLSTLLKLFKLRCCFVWFELAAVWLSFCVLFDVFCVLCCCYFCKFVFFGCVLFDVCCVDV